MSISDVGPWLSYLRLMLDDNVAVNAKAVGIIPTAAGLQPAAGDALGSQTDNPFSGAESEEQHRKLRTYAKGLQLDVNRVGWELTAIANVLASSRELNKRQRNRPREDRYQKLLLAATFVHCARQLGALLTVREGRGITRIELARAIYRRAKGVVPGENCWKAVGILAEDDEPNAEAWAKILLRRYQIVGRDRRVSKPPEYEATRNLRVNRPGGSVRSVHNWAPSQTELDGCVGWHSEYQKSRKQLAKPTV